MKNFTSPFAIGDYSGKETRRLQASSRKGININKRSIGAAAAKLHSGGFTLIELMIVVAIIGILVAIAIPSYQNYTRRAHYTEVVSAAAPYKVGVEECYQTSGDLESCQAGGNGVPDAIASNQGAGLIDNITVNGPGIITITPRAKEGITAEDTYILTPSIENGVLVWVSSGGGVEAGYAH